MAAAPERLVWQRAKSRCEYCLLSQAFSPLPHAIDHVIARQHHGPTHPDNLALASFFWEERALVWGVWPGMPGISRCSRITIIPKMTVNSRIVARWNDRIRRTLRKARASITGKIKGLSHARSADRQSTNIDVTIIAANNSKPRITRTPTDKHLPSMSRVPKTDAFTLVDDTSENAGRRGRSDVQSALSLR